MMEFGLLGPLVVRRGETELRVPQGNQRMLLAMLLLDKNRVVLPDDIAETLWGPAVPPSAPVTIRNYVRRLRQALGEEGRDRIGFRRGGYLISVAEDELDVTRFETMMAAAKAAARVGSWGETAAIASEALSLWRGEPLADIGSDALALREGPRLDELRLQTTEIRIEAELQLGRHAEALAELHRLAADHPLREHLYTLLMLTLYRCGRQAEALTAYQQARSALVGELGIEPGSELRELQQQILTADPALDFPRQPGTSAGRTRGTSAGVAGSLAPDLPRQLPPAIADFTGRTAELAALTQILDHTSTGTAGTVTIGAIGGTAGVGKTALAIHWAHRVAGRFPDGQLYVNLRGFDTSGTSVTAAEAIRVFLDALGMPPGRIPPDSQAQASMYRSVLARKRMLIVLDNARDEQQVRPLLPASPGSLVLVTSRNQLGGLAAVDGAQLISLGVLTHAEAVQMLTTWLGSARAAAERGAVDEIARLCACLPLALAVGAARAAARPSFPLAVLAAELRDAASRLEVLDAGDPQASVRAVFSWSMRQLSDQAAEMFRLLGIHPGPDISVAAAASLVAIAQADARRRLRELARGHLIAEHIPGRYAFHDLLRVYAASLADADGSDAERGAAVGRVLDYYLHTAADAARLLNPTREPIILAAPTPGAAPAQSADYREALAWFEAEHQVLLAAVTLADGSRFDSHAWQLPWAMTSFLQVRGHRQEGLTTMRTALAAATRLGDTAAQAVCHRLLGAACTSLGDHEQALSHYADSLKLYQRLGSLVGEAKIHHSLGFTAERQGRYADALGHAEQALRLFQALGDQVNEAGALNNMGWCHGLLGDYRQARTLCRQAATLCAQTGDRWNEGNAWDSVGYAEHHLGNFGEAATSYSRALSLLRESGDRVTEANILTRLGDTRHAAGELAQARETWQQALAILEDLQHPAADEVRAKLARASKPSDRESPAFGYGGGKSRSRTGGGACRSSPCQGRRPRLFVRHQQHRSSWDSYGVIPA
jgi:DNA-binding SARP family transcriptional activator